MTFLGLSLSCFSQNISSQTPILTDPAITTPLELHFGVFPGAANDNGFIKHGVAPFVSSGINVFSFRSWDDLSPVGIGGNHVYFNAGNFNGNYIDESTQTDFAGANIVFIPGKLRIGYSNTSWDNWKLRIKTDDVNAAAVNGLLIEHKNTAPHSYSMMMTVNHAYTKAFVIKNLSMTGQPTQETFKILGSGHVYCTGLKLMQGGHFPDYVFKSDYNLMSLGDLSEYIKEYSKLPGIPSAKEVENNGGFDVGEMQRLCLKKIEEMTLYIIKLNEENIQLSKRLEILEK